MLQEMIAFMDNCTDAKLKEEIRKLSCRGREFFSEFYYYGITAAYFVVLAALN